MKTVVAILSVAVIAVGGSTTRAQAATPAPAKPATTEKSEKSDAAAMLAAPGAITPESLAAAVGTGKDSAEATQEINRQLSASPDIQERVRVRFRAELPNQHPDIGEVLGLSSQQVNRLFDLLAQQNTDARTSTKAPAERIKADEAKLASMLGSKYPQWKEYKAGLPSRLQVRDLGAALIAGDVPLSDAKVGPLMSALITAQKQNSENGGPYTPESNRRLLDAASPILSAPQLEIYQKLLERQANRARPPAPPRN